jgi:hypothetical protein
VGDLGRGFGALGRGFGFFGHGGGLAGDARTGAATLVSAVVGNGNCNFLGCNTAGVSTRVMFGLTGLLRSALG